MRQCHPAPKVDDSVVDKDYNDVRQNRTGLNDLRLDDAIHRADVLAAGGIVMTHALHTGGEVDDVNGITFSDGIRGAFRQARAAGDAVFVDLHCHDTHSGSKVSLLIRHPARTVK